MKAKILDRLKRHVYPFTHLSAPALDMAAQALRIFDLCDEERIVFPSIGPEDLLFLIEGVVVIDEGLDSIRAEAVGEPYRFSSRDGKISIQAINSAVVCRANGQMVEDFRTLDELGHGGAAEEAVNPSEILLKLREAATFRSLPIENAYEALQRMTKVKVATGEEVVKQYEDGDAYYVVTDGKAEVWREELDDLEPQMVAVLGPGDGFGEESLVMKGGRNATVKMVTDGELMKLSKRDFDELISTSMIDAVKPVAAKALVTTGSTILDVRYEEEYEKLFIPGSVLIPLPDLRKRIDELDKATNYLVLCKKGSRAAAATLLLKQRGIKAMVIEGGIAEWPWEENE